MRRCPVEGKPLKEVEMSGKLSRRSGVATLFVLAAVAAFMFVASSPAFGMPPHPDLLKEIKAGSKPVPYFLANIDALRAKGVNEPEPPLKGAEMFGPPERAQGPSGSFRALALLVDFSDNNAQVAATFFDLLLFGALPGSVRDYYDEVSYGNLTLVTVNPPSATGWKRPTFPYTYYTAGENGFGTYPQNAQRLVEEVVDAVDPFVDFSQYDNDSDGYVDALFVIHAGPGAEYTGNPDHIWSHQWAISPRLKDGVLISTYSMEPEYWMTPGDMTNGVYCHELGHVFGLPDLYDYGYDSEGAGDWSLMAGGSWNGSLGDSPAHPDAWSRLVLGFSSATYLTENTTGLSVTAVETAPQIFYVWNCGEASDEFFLLENRQPVGYDAGLPGAGMLIWHVDQTRWNNDGQCENHLNCLCPQHYLVALEQADGLLELERGYDSGDTGDPYPGSTNKRVFDPGSIPNSRSYADCASEIAITNISNSMMTMTADVVVCAQGLTQINLTFPSNQSTIYSAPQFTWTSDGDPGTVYAVDLAIPSLVPFWSTLNAGIQINQKSWVMPQALWNLIPGGSQIFWRVRGADPAQQPLNIVTSDEVWAFFKN